MPKGQVSKQVSKWFVLGTGESGTSKLSSSKLGTGKLGSSKLGSSKLGTSGLPGYDFMTPSS
ncbi:MAG: hypothetical protein Fur0046_38280 [Cyanobacteria bacterium J069]